MVGGPVAFDLFRRFFMQLDRLQFGRSWQIQWTGYMSTWTYFKDEEVKGLDPELVSKLETARKVAGVPFIITSGFRSANGNSVLKGAVSDSSHLTGMAVDLHVEDHNHYCLMLKGLYAAGFRRFGH